MGNNRCWSKPIFTNVEDDLLISLRHIKNISTKNTKAVIPVHLSGRICEMNKINQYCSERNIYVIEDASYRRKNYLHIQEV